METEAEEVAGLKAALAEAEATNERLRVVALAQSEALAKLAESSADGTAATDKGGKGHVSGSDADARINELERRNGVYRRELVHAANELARLRGLRDSLDAVGGLRVLGDGSLTVNADALRVDDPIAGAISSVYVVRMGDSPSSSLTSSALSGSVAREAARRLRVPGKLPFDHKLNPMQLEMHVRLWERVGAELVAENTARKSAAEKLGRRVRALAAELDLAERRLAAYARDAAHPPQPPARNPALEALVAEDELLDELTEQTTRVNTSLQETLDLARKNQRRLAEARVAPSSSPSTARRRSPPEPESSWLSSVDGDEVAAFVEIPSFADMFGNDGALFDEDLASVGEPDPNPDESLHPFHGLSMALAAQGTTAAYWDAVYTTELARVEGGAGSGELGLAALLNEVYVWYGSEPVALIVSLLAHAEEHLPRIADVAARGELRLLEAGCGNGHLALVLAAMGSELGIAEIVGADRSRPAINVAKVLRARLEADLDDAARSARPELIFVDDDLTESGMAPAAFHVVIDKGSLDCLVMEDRVVDSDDDATESTRDREKLPLMPEDTGNLANAYLWGVAERLVVGGYFVLVTIAVSRSELDAYLVESAVPLVVAADLSSLFADDAEGSLLALVLERVVDDDNSDDDSANSASDAARNATPDADADTDPNCGVVPRFGDVALFAASASISTSPGCS
ncbi:uncharacterized protein AMSG_12246 [Thecamonas trahens ATCC 50062]|uniref:Methyltransferase domain-containing protein n=1 Tax=Thecamonas trahens ATCC 50062 TaxID=461836 RepID=A0A0L0DLJ3_THETB|nr:hypothetical protein AMSG_12246 [Thecamonas trahens ATCC 50062]KNC53177.1 hypothetical protein AMSG_12246 [Thecamonas trahens ATCC 50062]|eukprot:XP_013754700.1 hypothetical protein AMSG_12246 [Thecamonas trahens ATCC 50062]